MTYQAPVDDIMFALKTAADLESLVAADVLGGLDEATIRSIVEEAGKFATDVLDPLNWVGDKNGSNLINGKVVTPPGWKKAYEQFSAAGWGALPCPEEFGGQGLPEVVSMATCEIWNSANMAFGMCPLLTNGAIHAIEAGGSAELKAQYLPKMISGEWTGTMNLTEPQAGSDLNAVTARAVPTEDGTYRVFGTKIFISYGDHELTENIIHLVLARLPDAPPGTKGISLFLVPKVLVNADGSLGAMNDVTCAGIEHKLGIKASPTAVMKFGEAGGAIGYLVGEVNRGLQNMFVMMNAARIAVAMQGVAIAERATQRATVFAGERRQGRTATSKPGEMGRIIEHADIKRTLLTMKAMTQAARAISFATAREIDRSHRAKSDAERADGTARAALLTPVAKAFATDTACEVASFGIQVHGGMGFVEETGAAQHLRDARILPIYEGTNGIQAIDLVTRKLPLGGGAVLKTYLGELSETVREVAVVNRADFGRMGARLSQALSALEEASVWMGGMLQKNPEAALAGATPYLRLFAVTAGGVYLARGALAAARDGDEAVPVNTIAIARFFAENVAVGASGLAAAVTTGGDAILSLTPDRLSA